MSSARYARKHKPVRPAVYTLRLGGKIVGVTVADAVTVSTHPVPRSMQERVDALVRAGRSLALALDQARRIGNLMSAEDLSREGTLNDADLVYNRGRVVACISDAMRTWRETCTLLGLEATP